MKKRREFKTDEEMRAWQYREYRRKEKRAIGVYILLVLGMVIGLSIAFQAVGEKVYPYCLAAFFAAIFGYYGVLCYCARCPFCNAFIGRSRCYGDNCPSCGRLMKAVVKEDLFYLENCPRCSAVIGRTVAPYETCPMCEARLGE